MKYDRPLFGAVLIGFLAVYTALVFGFFSAEDESRRVLLLCLALPIAALLMAFPRAGLVCLALVVYFVRWLYDQAILPREATWLIDILILLLVTRTIFSIPWRQERMIAIERLIFGLLGFTLLSALLNSVGAVTVLVGLRLGFRYLLLFVAAYHLRVTPAWLRGYFVLLFVTGLVQPAAVFIQFTRLEWADWDRLSGTFGYGQTPGLALFSLILFAYLVSRMIEHGKLRLSYLLMIAWMSIGPFLGEAKLYFLFMPVLLLFMLRAEVFKRPLLSVALLAAGAALVVFVDYLVLRTGYWEAGRNPLTFVQQIPEAFRRDLEVAEYGHMDRGFWYVSAIRLAAASPRTVFLGAGPGAITESALAEAHSPKIEYYSRWGLTSTRTLSILWLLIEYGYLGVALILVLIYLVFRRGRVLRASPDGERRILGRTLESMALLYGVWLFYQSAWQLDAMAFAFWPLAGMLVHMSYVEEAERKQEQAEREKAAALARSRGSLTAAAGP